MYQYLNLPFLYFWFLIFFTWMMGTMGYFCFVCEISFLQYFSSLPVLIMMIHPIKGMWDYFVQLEKKWVYGIVFILFCQSPSLSREQIFGNKVLKKKRLAIPVEITKSFITETNFWILVIVNICVRCPCVCWDSGTCKFSRFFSYFYYVNFSGYIKLFVSLEWTSSCQAFENVR